MAANAEQLVEAFVAACVSSPIGNRLGKDALRVAVNAHRSEVVQGEVFHLDPLWRLFKEQEIDAIHVAVAFLRFKRFEAKLGVQILMPKPLQQIEKQGEPQVPGAALTREVDEILGLVEKPKEKKADAAREAPREAAKKAGASDFAPRRATDPRKLKRIAAGIAGVAMLAVVWFSYSSIFGDYSSVPKDVFSANDIPVREVRRSGTQVEAILSDSSWCQLPEETRKKQIRAAFDKLEPEGVDSVIVIEKSEMRAVMNRKYGREELYFL